MCSPAADLGKPPRQAFVVQLREARQNGSGAKSKKQLSTSQFL
jgi:hypothetical protein